MTRAAVGTVGLLMAVGGCELRSDDPAPTARVDVTSVAEAFERCVAGEHDAALATLDALLTEDPDDPDARVARGLCRWAVWGDSEETDDARAAYQDLTEAVEAVEGGRPSGTALDQILSHRAFVARALDGGWVRTLEDLDRAVALDPDDPTHVIDRAVVRTRTDDAPGARADLRRFLALTDTVDDERRAVARALLDGLPPPPADPDTLTEADAAGAVDAQP